MFDELKKIKARSEELEQLLASGEVLANMELCNKYAKELSNIRDMVTLYAQYEKVAQEIPELEHLLTGQHDVQFIELARKELQDLSARKVKLEADLTAALAPKEDKEDSDVIMEVRQGTGGREAALFAADLYRMYSRYAVRHNWKVELMSGHETELDGYKEVVFSVRGRGAYRHLRFESGVHRVQRVPDTEAQGRIHTSTATVAVLAEPEDVDLVITPNDLKIETYRSSGAGGQHMQKTDSAVRITHIATGLVVACQDERSQLKNKTKAMRILRARLLDAKQQAEINKISKERKLQVGSGDRSEKIRTYNFPDRRITDHRINLTVHQLDAIMDGDLDELIDALIKAAKDRLNERG